MKLKTVQANSFKMAFEVMKDILNDVNLYFTKDGMSLTTLDTARSALISLNLSSDNFEEYECPRNTIAGVNITNVYKVLKGVSPSDTLTIEINNSDIMILHIDNESKKTSTTFQLKLLDIDEERLELPDVPVHVTTVMQSIDFQRICRDMNNLSNELIMTRTDDYLVIACKGDFANQETVIKCTEKIPICCHGVYSLKYLNIFTKATGLCSIVRIMHEEENRFLVIKYNVANLGELNFYLSTKHQDN